MARSTKTNLQLMVNAHPELSLHYYNPGDGGMWRISPRGYSDYFAHSGYYTGTARECIAWVYGYRSCNQHNRIMDEISTNPHLHIVACAYKYLSIPFDTHTVRTYRAQNVTWCTDWERIADVINRVYKCDAPTRYAITRLVDACVEHGYDLSTVDTPPTHTHPWQYNRIRIHDGEVGYIIQSPAGIPYPHGTVVHDDDFSDDEIIQMYTRATAEKLLQHYIDTTPALQSLLDICCDGDYACDVYADGVSCMPRDVIAMLAYFYDVHVDIGALPYTTLPHAGIWLYEYEILYTYMNMQP